MPNPQNLGRLFSVNFRNIPQGDPLYGPSLGLAAFLHGLKLPADGVAIEKL